MKNISFTCFCFWFVVLNLNSTTGNWLSSISDYLGYKSTDNVDGDVYYPKIPYEVSTVDENFIKEAAKLTGVALSELDSCQHRVILKLKSDCDKLNDEQLAKMAVHLLNCQSWVEGRTIYACTDEMSIKDCTIDMDSDTWTSYHLMSNRARAVCYMVRQSQFRGLAEHTVNRLMDAARDQLRNLGEISNTQKNLKNLAEKTYLEVRENHIDVMAQQVDLKKAQLYSQLSIEDNIKRLADEKRLIAETHNKLVIMTKNIQEKLEDSLYQLQDQSKESKINHKELINDLMIIQEKAKEIFERIEYSSSMLIQQNDEFSKQYKSTFKSLQEMNKTVSELVTLVKGTWHVLEEKLNWIVTALGGTDLAIDRIYLIFSHFTFILVAMLTCAFLAARSTTRLLITLLPSSNLILALLGKYQHLELIQLFSAICIIIATQTLIIWVMSVKDVPKNFLIWKTKKRSESPDSLENYQATSSTNVNENEEYLDTFKEFNNFTPPESRNGFYKARSRSRSNTPLLINSGTKSSCRAKTRMGTPCKLSSMPGRDFCFRHQTGSSVIG